MAGKGKKKQPLILTSEEKEELQRLVRRRKTAQQLALRARIILKCGTGKDNLDVAEALGVNRVTVGKWRGRFIDHRLEGLLDEPRPGAPRKISDGDIEDVVCQTLESTPKGATHWSTRQMAKKVGLSSSTISRIWRAFGLQPHRSEAFVLSSDPLLIDKVRDVVGLYLNPPDRAVVLCVDEKSQIQALNRTQPLLPLGPGNPERRTTEYERHGTTSLFAALDVATGRVLGKCYNRHRSREFLKFLKEIEAVVPDDLDIHIILDNYSTHKTPSVKKWLSGRPRFQLHFTPTKGSWLNLVERWFGLLEDRQIKRGSHRSVTQLKAAIYEFIEANNEDPKPFVWVKTADEILASIARFAARTYKHHVDTSC